MKIGAIDIGSNAIRLLIVRALPTDNGVQYKRVEFIRIPLRMGDDAFKMGKISEEKMELFLMTMHAFKLILDIHKVKIFRACATSAMREASNGKELANKVKSKLKFPVDIISGKEESELILKSILGYFPENGNYLNIDVGGGSTEMTVILDHVPTHSVSYNIGTVRMMDGKTDPKVWLNMEKWVKEHTKGLKRLTALGTGGNINRLYRMGVPGQDGPMRLAKLTELYQTIQSLTIPERIYNLKMNPDRADVVEHAARIYINIMQWAGIEKLYAPSAGLKDGIVMKLWEEGNEKA
jgi:exopolyphosphatase / guanosine-5'-triphosphate,3'-diphosphate pyrophosphatase